MPACVSCGREIAQASVGELNICPDCRAAILARAPSQNPLPSRRRTFALENMPVTSVLIGINVLVFALMVLSGVSFTTPELEQLKKWGADYGPLTLGAHQYWRLLTSNYVHIGIIHIALNMWCLWNLGALAERIFDRWTYVLGYTACGIAGSILALWWHPTAVEAGASGAIFGIAGALIAALYLGRLPVPPNAIKATLKSLLSFAGYNLFFGAVIPAYPTPPTWEASLPDLPWAQYLHPVSLRQPMRETPGGDWYSSRRAFYCLCSLNSPGAQCCRH